MEFITLDLRKNALCRISTQPRMMERLCFDRVCSYESSITPLWNYGDSILLSCSFPEEHEACAKKRYEELISRVVSIETETSVPKFVSPDKWLDMTDDEIINYSPHGEWLRQQEAEALASQQAQARDASLASMYTLFRCPACSSPDVDVEQKQTRSADEGMTIFLNCKSCGKRSRKN